MPIQTKLKMRSNRKAILKSRLEGLNFAISEDCFPDITKIATRAFYYLAFQLPFGVYSATSVSNFFFL